MKTPGPDKRAFRGLAFSHHPLSFRGARLHNSCKPPGPSRTTSGFAWNPENALAL